MPIYEYACQKCKEKVEVIQRVGEEPLKICPHCGGRLKKLLSSPAIQFKGSGWYITDYARAKKEGESAASDKGESKEKTEKPAEKPAEKKTEAKEKKAKE
jgi:putative FmdB family regulatory protein